MLNICSAFGKRVRELRLAKGLSQEKLAEMTGLHRNYIGGIERGERNVGLENIQKIASALSETLSSIMTGIGNRDVKPEFMKKLIDMSPADRKTASEKLIQDLFIDLRNKVNKWAALTHQTCQARMGYIGQHLTSIVTGFPGSKTGARGDDLVHPDGESHSEIKTCYRVDQLGECKHCHTKIAILDKRCPSCGSLDLIRKDDSKWLIGIPATAFAEKEFYDLFKNKNFYFVLFEFEDLTDPETIIISIWEVSPLNKGFAYCMLDYYKNIWPKSKSHAPFNLWPYSLKFELMEPFLIYRSKIDSRGNITTLRFPGITPAVPHRLPDLTQLPVDRSHEQALRNLAESYKIDCPQRVSVKQLLKLLQEYRVNKQIPDATFRSQLREFLYQPHISHYIDLLPKCKG